MHQRLALIDKQHLLQLDVRVRREFRLQSRERGGRPQSEEDRFSAGPLDSYVDCGSGGGGGDDSAARVLIVRVRLGLRGFVKGGLLGEGEKGRMGRTRSRRNLDIKLGFFAGTAGSSLVGA